jgi:purine-binding chemotaxis protein CheW
MMPASPLTEPAQYLTFHLGEEEYAVGILRVREILEYRSVTRVPLTPPWIRGVLNLRGSVVPVIDLAAKLGLAPTAAGRRTCIVLVEVLEAADGPEAGGREDFLAGPEREATVLGILVDAVRQVVELLPGDVEPLPSFGTPVRIEYLLGMAKLKVDDGFALLLDLDRVLSTEELLRVQTLPEEATRPEEAGAAPLPPLAEGAEGAAG